ncbi:MAG: sulfotransferase [Caulobacteraceae bacterium]
MTTTPTLGGARAESAASFSARLASLARTDLAEAKALAVRARADGASSPVIHHLVGLELKDARRFEEAIAELGLGLQLDPRHAGLMTTVGFCLLELGRRQEAANVLSAAMRQDPRLPEAVYGYGCAAERLGALDSARSAFERAVALDPDHADALAGLSGLATRRRDWPLARSLAERSVALNGRQTDALMNLVRVDLGEEAFESAHARLEAILPLPFLHPLAHANAHILLADALDGLGRYEEAFAAYAAGKAEMRELYAGEFARPDELATVDVVRAMLKEFLESPAEAWIGPPRAVAPGPQRGHAFLMGFPRSGTTLLEQVIATHPDMVALGERPVMLDAEAEFLSGTGGMKRLAAVLSDMLEPYRDSYWRRVRQLGVDPTGKVFVDKHPLSAMRLPLMHKMFPRAKILFALRDPRDVVLSCFRRSFNMNANMFEFNTILGAARLYDAVMTAGQTYIERLPLEVHSLRHEDLVADFDKETKALCQFLGVEWTESLRDFARTKRVIATPSGVQIGRGLNADGVGYWRNYAFALEPALPILAPWVERFGYPAD